MLISNNYVIKDLQDAKVDVGDKYIPLYYSEIVRKIFAKTVNNDDLDSSDRYAIETSSNLHKYTKRHLISAKQDEKRIYKLWHTPSQIVYSEVPHKYQDG